MAEYIEREALIKRLEASPLIKNYLIMRGSQNLINGIFDLIKRQPTADVVEFRHEKWETEEVTQEWDKVQKFAHFHNNPNCKFFYSDEAPRGHDYCPNCGAKMDGKDGEE